MHIPLLTLALESLTVVLWPIVHLFPTFIRIHPYTIFELYCVRDFPSAAFSALTLLVGRQEGHPACKKTERWGAGVVICLERGSDLHMAQLMPLPLTVTCFSKIQIGFTFLVVAHLGSPGKRAVKRVCVCVCVVFLFPTFYFLVPCDRLSWPIIVFERMVK